MSTALTPESADPTPRPTRQWGRTSATRTAILDAALEVFLEVGYEEANIADIVQRSGRSVGSIYHHFGGKPELFIALWESTQDGYFAAAATAVAKTRSRGERSPAALFTAGAEGYLLAVWQNRVAVRMFLSDYGPPQLRALERERSQTWIRQNSMLLAVDDSPLSRVRVSVLTSIVGDGAREIILLESEEEMSQIVDATLQFIARVAV